MIHDLHGIMLCKNPIVVCEKSEQIIKMLFCAKYTSTVALNNSISLFFSLFYSYSARLYVCPR